MIAISCRNFFRIGLISAIIGTSALHAQQFAVTTAVSYGFPVLSAVNGVTENTNVAVRSMRSPSAGAEYRFASGVDVSANLSYQRDYVYIGETLDIYLPKISCWKLYKSIALNIGLGYVHPIGASDFNIYGSVAAGVGLVHSYQAIDTLDWDLVWEIMDEDGNMYMDTAQMHHEVTDKERHTMKLKIECVAGVEYQREHFFCRAYCGARTWLSPFERIQYHSYYSSTHYDFEESSEGNFEVRPGYFVCGLGVGWRFTAKP